MINIGDKKVKTRMLGCDSDIFSNVEETEEKDNMCFTVSGAEQKYYYVNLDTDIESPDKYRDVFHLLRVAKETDVITFVINTDGGYADTLLPLLYYVSITKAYTIAEVHKAYSAGAIFSLVCDDMVLHTFSSMMFHSIAYGIYGKVCTHETYLEYSRKENEKLLKKVRPGFLTDAEVHEIVNGKDLYLDFEAIQKKLEIVETEKPVDKKPVKPKTTKKKVVKK